MRYHWSPSSSSYSVAGLFRLSLLVDNFLHDAIIIAAFVSKEWHIVVDVAVPIHGSTNQIFGQINWRCFMCVAIGVISFLAKMAQ